MAFYLLILLCHKLANGIFRRFTLDSEGAVDRNGLDAGSEGRFAAFVESMSSILAIELPPGWVPALRDAMHKLIEDLKATLPAAFESSDFQARRAAIDQAAQMTGRSVCGAEGKSRRPECRHFTNSRRVRPYSDARRRDCPAQGFCRLA